MRPIFTLLYLVLSLGILFAQNNVKGDSHSASSNVIVKIEGLQSQWTKIENDATANTNTPTYGNENVTFNPTTNGIYINILNGSNKIKLLGLTGQLLLDGDLTQGHFFIPTRQGIYFLKINNKSFKVICK